MLTRLIQYEFGTGREVIDALESFDNDVRRYELQSSDRIPDNILGAILRKGLSDDCLKLHLILNTGRLKGYVEMLRESENVVKSQNTLDGGPVPWSIDALGKGMGKGKKGGGKQNDKGDFKGAGKAQQS